jgi:hypothetical protein
MLLTLVVGNLQGNVLVPDWAAEASGMRAKVRRELRNFAGGTSVECASSTYQASGARLCRNVNGAG